ncbi:PepSY domain-containing protein [Planomicrobium sp. YIM 101495]|uniref:PepSY domain-containing protein n=1 Tax=Planomicrobium sp. YIM 101495 TaxID=2665160 RepID=UPI0012B86612|nr:PepSY domain-containing protein [Planomicrobium sp. YIM 101495]MTD30427.1 hypothetical protein [Planomicrobium sp. YIM 101495]
MKKRVWIVGIAFVLLAGLLLVLFLNPSENQNVSEAEAAERVASLYGGETGQVTDAGNLYNVEFKNEAGRYRASVDKSDGTVGAIELLESAAPEPLTEAQAKGIAVAETGGTASAVRFDEQNGLYEVQTVQDGTITTVTVSAMDGEVVKLEKEAEEAAIPTALTPDDAIAIAKTYLDGVVDDVDFESTEDGGYFLVTIEKDESDQEVTVQIHAIRGDVMTVEWDD